MQRHKLGPFHSHSWAAARLCSLHSWYLDEPCCQERAGTRQSLFLPRIWGAGCPPCSSRAVSETGQRWLQLPGTSQVLRADRVVVLTCKQSRLERKLIGGNFIWNAEALFLEWLFSLLTTLEQTAAELRACVGTCFSKGSLPVLPGLLSV